MIMYNIDIGVNQMQLTELNSHCWQVAGAVAIPLRFISLSCSPSLVSISRGVGMCYLDQIRSANTQLRTQTFRWCVY